MTTTKLDHWVVYGLFDPRDGQVRYVGVTTYALRDRLRGHLWESRNRPVCARKREWIATLEAAGFRPEIAELEPATDEVRAHEAEQFFVRYLRAIGADLLNEGDGGPGSTGRRMPESARAAIGAKATQRMTGRKRPPFTDAARAAMQAAAQTRRKPPPRTDEYRQKLREAWVRRRARMTEVA